jgi:hypothetical protein
MSLRMGWLVLACALACGGPSADKHEPQTAKEKQRRDAKAHGEDVDKPNAKWGGWRYQGQRSDCFYVLGRRCFKTEAAACATAHCKAPAKCVASGGGPATISCSKS